MPEFLNIELMNWEDFWDLILRGVFNFLVILYLVRVLYYKATPRKDYLFTYLIIAQVVFLMVFLLENISVEFGFALGLFAIFGMLRYRTRQIPIREMTYLFLVIGVTVLNALANRRVSYAELLLANLMVIVTTYMLERVFLLKHEIRRVINYDNIDLIRPEKYLELLQDLRKRTGLNIHRAEVGRVDYLRDMARVSIYYFERESGSSSTEELPFESAGDDDD